MVYCNFIFSYNAKFCIIISRIKYIHVNQLDDSSATGGTEMHACTHTAHTHKNTHTHLHVCIYGFNYLKLTQNLHVHCIHMHDLCTCVYMTFGKYGYGNIYYTLRAESYIFLVNESDLDKNTCTWCKCTCILCVEHEILWDLNHGHKRVMFALADIRFGCCWWCEVSAASYVFDEDAQWYVYCETSAVLV